MRFLSLRYGADFGRSRLVPHTILDNIFISQQQINKYTIFYIPEHDYRRDYYDATKATNDATKKSLKMKPALRSHLMLTQA